MRPFFLLACCLFAPSVVQAQVPVLDVFSKAKSSVQQATVKAEDTQGLVMDADAHQAVLDHRPGSLIWELDAPGLGWVELELHSFCNISDDFEISRTTEFGTRKEHYIPNLVTYELTEVRDARGAHERVSGTVVFFRDELRATLQWAGRQWEIRPVTEREDRQGMELDYVLFDVAKSAGTNSFTCAVEDQERELQRMQSNAQRSMVPQCVEIGLDVDNFTYNTFADCYGAIDWALGVLAGVDQVYRTELNDLVTLQASYVNVWEKIGRAHV